MSQNDVTLRFSSETFEWSVPTLVLAAVLIACVLIPLINRAYDYFFKNMSDMAEIMPNIWIGNEHAAVNKDFLREKGIKIILNTTKEVQNRLKEDKDIAYFKLNLRDSNR